MCGGCVEKEYPNRGNICLENGSFLLNFTGCAVCNKRDFMLITNKSLKEEDGEEIVTYDHLCKNCHHVVARHEYTFSIMDEFQLCNCTIVGFLSVSLPIATILAEHGNSDKEVIFVFPNRHVELSNSVVSTVEYTMLCLLCGKAEDTISILPDDPRQMTLLF